MTADAVPPPPGAAPPETSHVSSSSTTEPTPTPAAPHTPPPPSNETLPGRGRGRGRLRFASAPPAVGAPSDDAAFLRSTRLLSPATLASIAEAVAPPASASPSDRSFVQSLHDTAIHAPSAPAASSASSPPAHARRRKGPKASDNKPRAQQLAETAGLTSDEASTLAVIEASAAPPASVSHDDFLEHGLPKARALASARAAADLHSRDEEEASDLATAVAASLAEPPPPSVTEDAAYAQAIAASLRDAPTDNVGADSSDTPTPANLCTSPTSCSTPSTISDATLAVSNAASTAAPTPGATVTARGSETGAMLGTPEAAHDESCSADEPVNPTSLSPTHYFKGTDRTPCSCSNPACAPVSDSVPPRGVGAASVAAGGAGADSDTSSDAFAASHAPAGTDAASATAACTARSQPAPDTPPDRELRHAHGFYSPPPEAMPRTVLSPDSLNDPMHQRKRPFTPLLDTPELVSHSWVRRRHTLGDFGASSEPPDDASQPSEDESPALSLPTEFCTTCGIYTSHLVCCIVSDTWHCNHVTHDTDGDRLSSCIIRHLEQHGYTRVRLSPSSPFGGLELRCAVTRRSDIFCLGAVVQDTKTLVAVSSATAAAHCPGYRWHPLVRRDDSGFFFRIAEWLVPDDGVAVTYAAQRAGAHRVLRKQPTPSPVVFASLPHYHGVFSNLVSLQAHEDHALSLQFGSDDLAVHWASTTPPIAYFAYDSREPPVMGDSLVMRCPVADGTYTDVRGSVVYLQSPYVGVELRCDDDDVDTSRTTGYAVRKEQLAVSFDRLQTALVLFCNDPHAVGPSLRARILNPQLAVQPFSTVYTPHVIDLPGCVPLNLRQRQTVTASLTQDLVLVEGPPGTGKTRTTAACVFHNAHQGRGPVLVCAPSNVAASNLALACHKLGLKVIRYFSSGRDARTLGRDLPPSTLIEHWITAGSSLDKLLRLQRSTGDLNDADRQLLKKLERVLYSEALSTVDVVCCTCSAAGSISIASLTFHTVFIDEAGQATEPEALVPVTNGARRLIMVGDTRQLRPVVMCDLARLGGLSVSLFERLRMAGAAHVALNAQYRMHPAISAFPSHMFYDGTLVDGSSQQPAALAAFRAAHTSAVKFPWPQPDSPTFLWHVCAPASSGVSGRGEESGGLTGDSYINRGEAEAALTAAVTLVIGGAATTDIVIISMYDAHTRHIQQLARERCPGHDFEVNNVDSLQGHERPFVILSLVRSNSKRAVGFLRDPRRACVALTRAQKGLVVIADVDTVGYTSPWREMLQHYHSNELLVTGTLDALQIETNPPALRTQDDPALVNLADFSVGYRSPHASSLFDHSPPSSHHPPLLPPPAPNLADFSVGYRRCYSASQWHRSLARSAAASDPQPVAHLLYVLQYRVGEVCNDYDCQRTSTVRMGRSQLRTYEVSFDSAVNVVCTFPTGRHTTATASMVASWRLIQYWWRARVVGYISAKDSVVYWRLAHSRAPDARIRFDAFIHVHSFRTSPALRGSFGPRLLQKQLNTHDTNPPRTYWRLPPWPSRTRLFRLVRNMRCGYGALACRHAIFDSSRRPVRDATGAIATRTYMAVSSDWKWAVKCTQPPIEYYLLFGESVRSHVPHALFEMGFAAPGGGAMGVHAAGFDAVCIDNSDDLNDPLDWFHRRLPELQPGSPLIHFEYGDAVMARERQQAVLQHPRGRDVIVVFDSPECDAYGTATELRTSDRSTSGPARRKASVGSQRKENLSESVHAAHARWQRDGTPYVVETVVGARFEPPEGASCTTYEAIMLGVPSQDRHKFYHPANCPLYVDRPLIDCGRWLRDHTCAGASKLIHPTHPHGQAISSCCIGQTLSLHNSSYNAAHLSTISKALGLHPEHVTSYARICDALPVRLATHTAAVAGMWSAQSRLHTPCVSFDRAHADPWLGCWMVKALARGGSRALSLPATRVVVIFTPTNLPGSVLVETRNSTFRLPSFDIAPRGDLHTNIASAFNSAYPATTLDAKRLSLVCDFLPTLVFHTSSLPCNDAHAVPSLGASIADGLVAIRFDDLVDHLLQPDAVGTVDRAAIAQYVVRDDLCAFSTNSTDALARMRRHASNCSQKSIDLLPTDVSLVYAFLNGDADVSSIARVRTTEQASPVLTASDSDHDDITGFVADGAVFGAVLTAAPPAPPPSFAALVVPDVQAAARAYEKARAALEIPRSSLGGGGGMPKPVTLTYVGVVVILRHHVLTYAYTAHLHSIFTGRDTAWTALRGELDKPAESQHNRRHDRNADRQAKITRRIITAKTHDLMAALHPWLGCFTFYPRLQDLAEAAVEASIGGTQVTHTTAARNETGSLVSRSVASRASVVSVWAIDISAVVPPGFQWNDIRSTGFSRNLTRRPSGALYDKHDHFPVLRGGLSVADTSFTPDESAQRHVPPGQGSLRLSAVPGTVYSWPYEDLIAHLMGSVGQQGIADVVCRLLDAPPGISGTVSQVCALQSSGVCHVDVPCSDRLDTFAVHELPEFRVNQRGETRLERSLTRCFLRDVRFTQLALKSARRTKPAYDCSDCQWIILTFGARAAHVVDALRSGSKSIESRRNLGTYRFVREGWLLCCTISTHSPPLWLVVREVFFYSSYSEAARAHGLTLVPWVDNLLDLTEVELEYTFFRINLPLARVRHAAQHTPLQRGRSANVDSWHLRTGSPDSVVCWRVSRVPNGAILPTRATLVASTPFGLSMSRPRSWETLYSGLQHAHRIQQRRFRVAQWCRYAGRLAVSQRVLLHSHNACVLRRFSLRLSHSNALKLLRHDSLQFRGRFDVFRWHHFSRSLQHARQHARMDAQRTRTPPSSRFTLLECFQAWRHTCSVHVCSAACEDVPDATTLSPWVTLRLCVSSGSVHTSLSLGGNLTRVVRNQGITDHSLYDVDKVDAVCVFTDCVSFALRGTAAQVASVHEYSKCEHSPSPNGSGYARRSTWREPGSVTTFNPPDAGVAVHHLHVKWSPRSPSSSVSPTCPKSPGYRSAYVCSPDTDTLEARRSWLSQALDRLSASLGPSYTGTIAFPWSDCAEYGEHMVTAFASQHPRARVLVVQRTTETMQYQLERLRTEVKQASRDVRRYLKRDDSVSPTTLAIAMELSRAIERTLLRDVRAQLVHGETASSFPDAQTEFRRRFRERTAELSTSNACDTLAADRVRRRDNECTDERYRSRVRDALTTGELTEAELHSLFETHLKVREQGRLLASRPDADQTAIVNMSAALPVGALRPVGRVLKPSADVDAETATVALAQDVISSTPVRVSSVYGRRTPCRLLDTFLYSGSSLHQLAVQALILDGGAGTCLWGADGTHGARSIMARYPEAVQRVDPLPSSIRRIAGVCSLSEVSFWVSFTLVIGGCEFLFEDVPVLYGHSGLLLGNDCIAAARSQISYDSSHGGTIVFRHADTLAPISRPVRFVCSDAAVHEWSSLCARIPAAAATVALASGVVGNATASSASVTAGIDVQDDGRVRIRFSVDAPVAPSVPVPSHVRTALRVGPGGRVSLTLNTAPVSPAAEYALQEVAPVGFTPKNVVCEPWSETLIPLQIPFALRDCAKIGVVPLEDKATYGDLGVLIAPTVATSHNGTAHVRAINFSGKHVSLPLLTPIVRYIIDPTYSTVRTEYDPDTLMDSIHVGVDDPPALRACKAMLSRRLSAFRSTLSSTHLMRHEIRTPDVDSGKAKAPCAPNRMRPPIEMSALEEMVAKLRKERCVEPADPTEYNALPLVLHKPDGTMRPALNYIGLNFVSEKDVFPLPNAEANIASLGRANWFSTLDLLQGFMQIELEPSSKKKTAFTVGGRQWQFTRMPMGLSSSPGAFMRVVDAALRGLPPGIAFAYV